MGADDEEYACPENGIPLDCEKEPCRERERCRCADWDLAREKRASSKAYGSSNDWRYWERERYSPSRDYHFDYQVENSELLKVLTNLIKNVRSRVSGCF
jgi:hypothetical protein